MASTTSGSSSIDWDDVTKKEARGSNDEDLGEVQEVGQALDFAYDISTRNKYLHLIVQK